MLAESKPKNSPIKISDQKNIESNIYSMKEPSEIGLTSRNEEILKIMDCFD